MRRVLEAVKTAVEAAGFACEIGVRPAVVADNAPYVVLFMPSTLIDGTIDDLDADRGHLVQVKTFGTFVQAAELQARVEPLLKTLVVPGVRVMKAQTEMVAGPNREAGLQPEPYVWWCDLMVRVTITPDPTFITLES